MLPGGYATLVLATTAVAVIAMSSTASAQSVLERVLGQINGATNQNTINGAFANIAENIGGGTTTAYMDANGDIISATQYDDALNAALDSITATSTATTATATPTGTVISYSYNSVAYATMAAAVTAAEDDIADDYTAFQLSDGGIDGSITNIIDGITNVTQEATAGTVTAIEYNMPTFDFGDMATTALGAVNTGEITLGVNSTVDNAKTSTTEALSSVMTQLGGSSDTSAIVLNVASNMTAVNGSISNTMEEVNCSIGNLSTTALGAVNTGTIVSGVNGIVTGITGASSGQSGL